MVHFATYDQIKTTFLSYQLLMVVLFPQTKHSLVTAQKLVFVAFINIHSKINK